MVIIFNIMCTLGASYSLGLGIGSCQSESVKTVAERRRYKGTGKAILRLLYVILVVLGGYGMSVRVTFPLSMRSSSSPKGGREDRSQPPQTPAPLDALLQHYVFCV